MRSGDFPVPVKLGGLKSRSIGWKKDEIVKGGDITCHRGGGKVYHQVVVVQDKCQC